MVTYTSLVLLVLSVMTFPAMWGLVKERRASAWDWWAFLVALALGAYIILRDQGVM